MFVRRIFFVYIIFMEITVLLITGCSSRQKQTDSSNFLQRTEVINQRREYFNPIDSEKFNKCIGDNPSLCNESFEPGKKLDMEAYEVEIDLPGQTSFGDMVEDFAYLVAGELAIKRGFENFIQKSRFFSSVCSELYGVDTYGQVIGNYYYSTSTLTTDAICSAGYTTSFLLFNDYNDIKKGVISYSKLSNKFFPPRDLYFDNITYVDKLSSGDKMTSEWFRWHTIDSWKSYYRAKEIVAAIRDKYNIRAQIDLEIKDEKNISQSPKTVQEKYKIDGN